MNALAKNVKHEKVMTFIRQMFISTFLIFAATCNESCTKRRMVLLDFYCWLRGFVFFSEKEFESVNNRV